MGKAKFEPDLDEHLMVRELQAEILRKLIKAKGRMKASEASYDAIVHIRHGSRVRPEVKIWNITSSYAVDALGNILWKWDYPHIDWPKVSYEVVVLGQVGLPGSKVLRDHLDDVCTSS